MEKKCILLKDNFTDEERSQIALQIKPKNQNLIEKEFESLQSIGHDAHKISERCRIGNAIVDYFTFSQRLCTKGKYNVNFFEFIANIEYFKQKKFIQNMMEYYNNVDAD